MECKTSPEHDKKYQHPLETFQSNKTSTSDIEQPKVEAIDGPEDFDNISFCAVCVEVYLSTNSMHHILSDNPMHLAHKSRVFTDIFDYANRFIKIYFYNFTY